MKTFTTRIRARYCETDAAEVIYYGSFLHYFEVGKMEMFRDLDLPYRRDIPIVETLCKYPAPAFFDDLLEIRTHFDEVHDKGFKIVSNVYRVEKNDDFTLVGTGYTKHIFIDKDRNPSRLPDYYWHTFKRIKDE